jgi:TPP-dependent 2-oxoacid decarboxylase
MFGVPGDFNLEFLVSVARGLLTWTDKDIQDLVEDHPTIDWVGNW